MYPGKVSHDPAHAAGFDSIAKLVNTSKSNKKGVEEWQLGQNTYILHKPVRKMFPRTHKL